MDPAESSRLLPIVCLLREGCEGELAKLDALCSLPNHTSAAWSEKLFRAEFINSCSSVWGARLRGALIGFLVTHVVADEAHIMNFGVDPSFRGRGIGRYMLFTVLKELDSRSVAVVTLEVRKGNAPARHLYESLGFTEQGVRSGYYPDGGEDGVVERLDLKQFLDQHSAELEQLGIF